MRTLGPVMLVLSFVVATALLTGSGAVEFIGGDAIGQTDAQDEVEGLSEEKNITGEAASNEGSIVGLVVGGSRNVADFVSLVAFFPSILKAMSIPSWLANPLGWIAQLVSVVGLAQFIAGRFYE